VDAGSSKEGIDSLCAPRAPGGPGLKVAPSEEELGGARNPLLIDSCPSVVVPAERELDKSRVAGASIGELASDWEPEPRVG